MNPDITPENIGDLTVQHNGIYKTWTVSDIVADEDAGTIEYKLASSDHGDTTFTTDRFGFNDSLAVVRASIKKFLLAELAPRVDG